MAGLLALLAGCGTEVAGAPGAAPLPPQEVVDSCSVLTERQLLDLGAFPESKFPVSELEARGCGWRGDPFTFSLTTDPGTVADYLERRDDAVFASMRANEVNGRPGAQFLLVAHGDEGCGQVVTAGSGGLVVDVSDSSGLAVPVDECAEALRIMQLIEPKLPKAGS